MSPWSFAKELLLAAPNLNAQLVLLAIHALFWYYFIEWSSVRVIATHVNPKPWKARWVELHRRMFKKNYGITYETQELAFDFACKYCAIMLQHVVGGILCLPSVLGLRGPVVCSLACHGVLCEAGWEFQDLLCRVCQVAFGGTEGRKKNPPTLLMFVWLHHVMGLSMSIPMNRLYHDNAYYHEFAFLLQCASSIALGLQSYGYTLDVTTASGLRSMKASVVVTWLVVSWSRVLRYAIVGSSLLRQAVEDGNMRMLCVGLAVFGCMGLMNVIIFIDATGKLIKFLPKKHVPTTEISPVDLQGHEGTLPRLMGQDSPSSGAKTACIEQLPEKKAA